MAPWIEAAVNEVEQRMATSKITMTSKYQTRDGRAVRILCVDGPRPFYPVVGYIGNEHVPDTWTAEGKMFTGIERALVPSDIFDLILVPTKHEGWAVIRPSEIFLDRESARQSWRNWTPAEDGQIVHVTWED
jgi:hypothetical protein